MFTYKTSGVCATEIRLDVKDNTIENVEFIRGCAGNLFGISMLVKGMKTEEAIQKLEGIKCGNKTTSCPDQLTKALRELRELSA